MKPDPLKYYQHRYGGIYYVTSPEATSTVDKSKWVVYTHAYPFDTNVWIRPYEEFSDGRFREISGDELTAVFQKDRLEFQKEIQANKIAAKK